ncbi:acetate/propionate family kinase [Sulfurimonas sp.]
MKIAVINMGSSSLKVKVFDFPSKELIYEKLYEEVNDEVLKNLDIDFSSMDVVGHRVVHGAEKFYKSTLINDEVLQTIKELSILAPLHNPANVRGIELVQKKAPKIPQIAVFDTAFHATMPKEAYIYALPYDMYEKYNIRRYGFHGSSHSYLLREASKLLKKSLPEVNIITLHLGNGASACAIKEGKSIDTSMGFTPLEGLVMGTRCGDLDPNITLFIQRELNVSAKRVEGILNKESGLLGVCGESDMRIVQQCNNEKRTLAFHMMVRRIQKYIGAYMILLEDIDAIVFSGGIGENSKKVRDAVMDNSMLKNIKTLVIKTDEELEIANECYKIVKKEDI